MHLDFFSKDTGGLLHMKKKMLVLFMSLLLLSMSITNSVFASCGHTILVSHLEKTIKINPE